ncbi:MAG: hypothetical protein U0793_10355 [Gemmataceae bacterium]
MSTAISRPALTHRAAIPVLPPAPLPSRVVTRGLVVACGGVGALLVGIMVWALQFDGRKTPEPIAAADAATEPAPAETVAPPTSSGPAPGSDASVKASVVKFDDAKVEDAKTEPAKTESPPAAAPDAGPVETPASARIDEPKTVLPGKAPALPADLFKDPLPRLAPPPKVAPVVDCTKLGTRIVFFKDPPDAFKKARDDHRLVFFIHLSGNFEDAGFT